MVVDICFLNRLSRALALVVVMALSVACKRSGDTAEGEGGSGLAARSGGGEARPVHVLIVASRDAHADLNMLLTHTPERGFVIQTLQRDYAKFSHLPGCRYGLKLTDNLALHQGDMQRYKTCFESFMGAQYAALRATQGAFGPKGASEQIALLGAKQPFKISQVIRIELSELDVLLQKVMEAMGLLRPQGLSDLKALARVRDVYELACSRFANLMGFLAGTKDNRDYLCSPQLFVDLGLSRLDRSKGQRLQGISTLVQKKVTSLAQCIQTKIRERGAYESELKSRSCVGHVLPDLAGSYQREFNGASLLAEVLGYASVFRRVKPDTFASVVGSLCQTTGCKRAGRNLDLLAFDALLGQSLAEPRYFWKDGYTPVPIVVWDGIFDDGGRPSVDGWDSQNNILPSHAVFHLGRARFFDTRGRDRGTDCSGALRSQLVCQIAYPSKGQRYAGRVGPEGGWSFGYLPWVLPPPL